MILKVTPIQHVFIFRPGFFMTMMLFETGFFWFSSSCPFDEERERIDCGDEDIASLKETNAGPQYQVISGKKKYERTTLVKGQAHPSRKRGLQNMIHTVAVVGLTFT